MPDAEPKRKRYRYPPEIWREILALALHGIPVALIAQQYRISKQAIYNKQRTLTIDVSDRLQVSKYVKKYIPLKSPLLKPTEPKHIPSIPNPSKKTKTSERVAPERHEESIERTRYEQWARLKSMRREYRRLMSPKARQQMTETQRQNATAHANRLHATIEKTERYLHGLEGQDEISTGRVHVLVGVAVAQPGDWESLRDRHKAGELITVDTVNTVTREQ
jgi:hypothetical protein